MKPRFFTAILLFVSAYSPLFLILAVKDFDFEKTHKLQHPLAVSVLMGITILSVIILFVTFSKINRGNMPVTIKFVKNRSTDLINYTIPYILSFFGFDLSKWGDIISLSIFLFIMMVLTIKSKSVFLNPILSMAGYGLYDLEYIRDKKDFSVIVLCKYDLKEKEVYYIRKLTRFLYLAVEKKGEKINGNK